MAVSVEDIKERLSSLMPALQPAPKSMIVAPPLFKDVAVLPDKKFDNRAVPLNKLNDNLPNFLKHTTFKTKHGPVTFYMSQAPKEELSYFGFSGLKCDLPLTFSELKELSNDGISFGCVAIPNMGRSLNFVDALIEMAEEIMLDPQAAEIKEWLDKDCSTLYFGHSTGAQLFLHLIKNPEILTKVNKDYDGIVLSSLFAKCTGSDNMLKRSLFYKMCEKHPYETAAEFRIGRHFMRKNNLNHDPIDTEYRLPAMGQTLELLGSGGEVYEDTFDSLSNIFKLIPPALIIASEDDSISSPDTQKTVAVNANMAFLSALEAGHVPLSDDNTRQIFRQASHHMAQGTFRQFAQDEGLYLPIPEARRLPAPAA